MNVTQLVTVEGVPMVVRFPKEHPLAGQPLPTSDGQPITITLLGPDSQAYQALEQQKQNRLLREMRARRDEQDNPEWTAEQLEADATELLVACTVGWSGIGIDEDETPWSPEAARKLYTNPRARFIRRQAKAFVEDSGNFFTAWAMSSPPSPNGSSH